MSEAENHAGTVSLRAKFTLSKYAHMVSAVSGSVQYRAIRRVTPAQCSRSVIRMARDRSQ